MYLCIFIFTLSIAVMQLSLAAAVRSGTTNKGGVAVALLAELYAGANVAAPDALEALHMAVAEGDCLAVDFLLRNGCSANQVCQSTAHRAHWAEKMHA